MRTEDGSIIHRCLNGEPEAFGILVDKYKEGIYAYAHTKLRDFRDAQDVTQEVFVRAYRDLRSLRRWESFAFWLYRIASARCKLWVRTQSRRVDQDFIEDQDPEVLEIESMSAYRYDRARESLQESMDSLPETYREVLMLHYFGGMTIKDIAKAIGVSPGAVGMRLSRARAQLKEEMTTMMDTAFEGQRLPAGFTFRIVEAVKRIKINPMPRTAGLPWGLSLAAGVIITVLSLSPYMNISSHIAPPTGLPLPAEMKVPKTGEIRVDILKTSEISVISSKQGDGGGGEPQFQSPQNALMLASRRGDGKWTEKADMTTPRSAHCAAVVNGKIYCIGGGPSETDVQEYDPLTDTWTKRANAPEPKGICWASGSVVNDKIYVIGGEGKGGVCSRVWEYDPSTDVWTRKSDMPTSRTRILYCTNVVDGKIYVLGGIKAGENLANVEEYDPATDTWTQKADMPNRRASVTTAAVKGKIYVFWGRTNRFWEEAGGETITTVEMYDPKTETWTERGDAPNLRYQTANIVLNDRIYLIGGNGVMGDPASSTVEEYDPETDTWTEKAGMLTERWMHAAAAVNGKIYVIGGAAGIGDEQNPPTIIPSVEEYTPDWLSPVSPQGKLPTKWGEVKSD